MKVLKYFGLVILGLVILLFFVRLVLPSQVDDVSPLMNCSDKVLDLADVYFVVPKFEGIEIEREWCEGIKEKISSSQGFGIWDLGFGKKSLAMHSVYHTYEEFGIIRGENYFDEGVEVFRNCFGLEPKRFKPGQLKWIKDNDWIKDSVDVELFWNQVFHKVYHCGDSGLFPNWVIRIF